MATTLEMLWERDDPAAVLRDRFGFASAVEAAAWVGRTLDAQWGVAVEACERIVMSDRNALAWVRDAGGQPLLLKWSVAPERFARLAVVADVTAWFGSCGLPVAAPLPTRHGRVQAEVDGVSAVLQRVLVRTWLDVDDPRQVHHAGVVLAQVHRALAEYPGAAAARATVQTAPPAREQITGWLDSEPATLSAGARAALVRIVEAAPAEPSATQLVHGDVRAANLLVADGDVTGMLDLEDLWFDTPVGELARSAVLLGTRFHDWGPVSPAVRAEFLAGYRSVRDLDAEEIAWWEVLVCWYSLALVPPGDDPTGWGATAAELLAG